MPVALLVLNLEALLPECRNGALVARALDSGQHLSFAPAGWPESHPVVPDLTAAGKLQEKAVALPGYPHGSHMRKI